ncbi:hypothetical protein WP1_188 [Pseudomonas phage WP1]
MMLSSPSALLATSTRSRLLRSNRSSMGFKSSQSVPIFARTKPRPPQPIRSRRKGTCPGSKQRATGQVEVRFGQASRALNSTQNWTPRRLRQIESDMPDRRVSRKSIRIRPRERCLNAFAAFVSRSFITIPLFGIFLCLRCQLRLLAFGQYPLDGLHDEHIDSAELPSFDEEPRAGRRTFGDILPVLKIFFRANPETNRLVNRVISAHQVEELRLAFVHWILPLVSPLLLADRFILIRQNFLHQLDDNQPIVAIADITNVLNWISGSYSNQPRIVMAHGPRAHEIRSDPRTEPRNLTNSRQLSPNPEVF